MKTRAEVKAERARQRAAASAGFKSQVIPNATLVWKGRRLMCRRTCLIRLEVVYSQHEAPYWAAKWDNSGNHLGWPRYRRARSIDEARRAVNRRFGLKD